MIKTCDACNAAVVVNGKRDFAGHVCPKAGQPANDLTHSVCPTHGTLVWTVGPYSTYRVCDKLWGCNAGKNGKPWRYCAPRGGARTDESTPAPMPMQPFPADTKVAAPIPTPTPNTDTTEAQMPTEPKAPPKRVTERVTASGVDLSTLGTLGEAIQQYVDSRAHQLASEAVAAALKDAKLGGPSIVNWTINAQPFAVVEGVHHKALPRLLKLYAAGFRNFLVVGPAGSGKTTLAKDLARALKLAFGSVSCTSGMSESALTGRAIPDLTTGKTVYQSTDFVRMYEAGGVFLIDEVDAADPNVMLVINSGTANGHMPLPNREEQPSATRHDSAVIILAANTWGTGADRQYVGRNQLDAAFLDRFVGTTIEVDYDRDLESALVGDAHICATVWTIRDKVRDLKLRRVVGTRFLLSVTRLVKSAGESLKDALQACTTGWTTDELSRAGVR